jgi:hypothetical protein
LPLGRWQGVKVLHERVAGIDVHKDMIKVAIRSPGEKPWTRKTEIFEFRTFYGVLQEVARLLRRRGVTHVAMEASGVYTDPVYYALTELDFTEVIVVNPAHVKALKGHKTDAKDCAPIRCSRSPTRSSSPGSLTPTSARTSTPAGNPPGSSTPTWNPGCRSSTPAARSPSPSAPRRAIPRQAPQRRPPDQPPLKATDPPAPGAAAL